MDAEKSQRQTALRSSHERLCRAGGCFPGLFLDKTFEAFEAFEVDESKGAGRGRGEGCEVRKPLKASKVRMKASKPPSSLEGFEAFKDEKGPSKASKGTLRRLQSPLRSLRSLRRLLQFTKGGFSDEGASSSASKPSKPSKPSKSSKVEGRRLGFDPSSFFSKPSKALKTALKPSKGGFALTFCLVSFCLVFFFVFNPQKAFWCGFLLFVCRERWVFFLAFWPDFEELLRLDSRNSSFVQRCIFINGFSNPTLDIKIITCKTHQVNQMHAAHDIMKRHSQLT